VNDVIHYECLIDIFVYSLYRTLQVRKISGIFPQKFLKVSDILFFRKSYNPTDNRPMTDLASWNISNDHISATGHPIYFIFGFRVTQYSGSADRMALPYFQFDQIEDQASRHLGKLQMATSLQPIIRST